MGRRNRGQEQDGERSEDLVRMGEVSDDGSEEGWRGHGGIPRSRKAAVGERSARSSRCKLRNWGLCGRNVMQVVVNGRRESPSTTLLREYHAGFNKTPGLVLVCCDQLQVTKSVLASPTQDGLFCFDPHVPDAPPV